MHGPAIRIALRYLAGLLVATGLIGAEHVPFIDSDDLGAAINVLVTAVGLLAGLWSEYRYDRAKKLGRAT